MQARIVNIIESSNGNISGVDSFIIGDEKKTDEVVEKAEALFIKKAKEKGLKDEDVEDAFGFGYDNNNGYSIALSWSNNVE